MAIASVETYPSTRTAERLYFSESVCFDALRYANVIKPTKHIAKIRHKVPQDTEPLVTVDVGTAKSTTLHYDYIVLKNFIVTAVFIIYGDGFIKEVIQSFDNRNQGCSCTVIVGGDFF
jgi:hypothetical protein